MTIPSVAPRPGSRAVVGVGLDLASVERFSAALRRTPGLAGRLFTAAERVTAEGRPRRERSLAARFAAKEAVAKALGVPRGMRWHDCVIDVAPDGKPVATVTGTVAKACAAAGVSAWELSLTHDGGLAAAVAVALA